ncbi:MAG: hypothetical protein ACRET0_02785 [Steroidobacteraceae bacterium]
MQVIHFTVGATDPLEDFRAHGVRFVPLAAGADDNATAVSCLHLAPGAVMADWPCTHDSVLLLVHGDVTVDLQHGLLEVTPGVGVLIASGEPCELRSVAGAIALLVEAPRLAATAAGLSTPTRIAGQRWPGERAAGVTDPGPMSNGPSTAVRSDLNSRR